MKTYFSVIKYAPNPDREEYFGIGLIMVSPELGIVKIRFSRDRVKRINRAIGINKSLLLETAMQEIEALGTTTETVNLKHLEYLSIYENGVVRYSQPKPLILYLDDQDVAPEVLLEQHFNSLFQKLIADTAENNTTKTKKTSALGTIFRQQVKGNKEISTHLDIGYNVQEINEINSNILLPDVRLDYIGGNGSIYCGYFLDFNVKESTLVKNISETLSLYDCLNLYYNTGEDAEKKEQKIIIDKKQCGLRSSAKALKMLHLVTENKPCEVVPINDIQEFILGISQDVQALNVRPFTVWVKKHQPKYFE